MAKKGLISGRSLLGNFRADYSPLNSNMFLEAGLCFLFRKVFLTKGVSACGSAAARAPLHVPVTLCHPQHGRWGPGGPAARLPGC